MPRWADVAIRAAELCTATEHELSSVVGDSSLCAVSRGGASVPAAKYLEGRTTALREVVRRARREPADDAVTHVRQAWRRALRDVEDGGFGRDWLAYRTGGVDALDELAG